MRALVLSGGGARGAYEAGAAKALLQREEYDLICGVSIGAINAALIAAGDEDALDRFWHEAFPSQALSLFPHIPHLRRVVDHVSGIGAGGTWHNAMRVARAASELRFLRQLWRTHNTTLSEVAAALGPMLDFTNRRRALLVGATNVSRGTAAAFYASAGSSHRPPARLPGARAIEYREMTQENFIHMLLASSAMPGLFNPIELAFEGEHALYADGCILHNSPLGLAIDAGATEVTVVFVDPERSDESNSDPGFAQMATNIVLLWQQRVLEYELRLAEQTNEIVRLGGAPGKREVTIRYVRPEQSLHLDVLSFDDLPAITRAFAVGMKDGAAQLQRSLVKPLPVRAQPRKPNWLAQFRFFGNREEPA